MKNRIILTLLGVLCFSISQAQLVDPVKWTTSVEKVKDNNGNIVKDQYILVATATMEGNYHMYSQNIDGENPIPTTFIFDTNSDYEVIGNTLEEEGHTEKVPVFDNREIKYFAGTASFRQQIKVLNDELSVINAEVEYMACDDTSCTPPTIKDLVFTIKSGGAAKVDAQSDEDARIEAATASGDDMDSDNSNRSLWAIFIISFLSGFAALLTPCVFPMIPMTVSFFTKQSKTKAAGIKNAIIYGLSIIIIYVFLGWIVSQVFGADALNALATNVWFNTIFFLLLIIFGVSFLGAFEITLPSSWGTKIDNQADRGGIIGIFFMALALAIVSFSCTGPIVGTLLVEAASKGGMAPLIGMFGFSLAIALPFTLFAAFPGWLNSMPKSGGWLNTVKVVLGFLEIAFAFKFLSQADLVLQLHLLEREVFIAIWIAIFGTLTLYLFGKIKLPHDSPLSHISVGRLSLGLITLSFTFYMIPGLWGAPLKLISAFPPPQHYSESPYGVGFTKLGGGGGGAVSEIPDGAHLLPPHDILAFDDYDKGLAYAKKVGKPVMIDFTGHSCVNCRKMENNVWIDEGILNMLKNDVVLISLYVDEENPFPEGVEPPESKLRPGKKLKTISQKWVELQTLKYKTNTQPFYVLMDHDEENLIKPRGYTPDIMEYKNWLKEGISNFKK
ncbi:thioredoxin family protein [Flavobacteriaceae bacterium F08102]|nr:thioredoxin family protein [Flavobacteriaceae bacterium F08102]